MASSLIKGTVLILRHAGIFIMLGLQPVNALATVHLFSIDPTATSLTLQGNTGTGSWNEQGPGSLTATFQGWLAVDLEASSIQILAGGLIADQTNAWQPGPNGSATPTLASYGAKATIGTGITANNVTVALRNLALEIASPQITTTNGPIDASGVTFTISSDPSSALDYLAHGLVFLGGSRRLGGLSSTNAGGAITLPIFPEVQTLNIPIDISLTSQVLAPNDTTLHFTGAVVARRDLMILNRHLLWLPSPTNPQQVTLIWDGGLRLQQATTLAPPDWTDFAVDPPSVISVSGPAAFFRVVAP